MKTDIQARFGSLLMRTLSSVGGALLGSICVLIFFMGIQFAIRGIETGAPKMFTGFGFFGITFIAALFSNVFASVFMVLADRQNFKGHFRDSITLIFFTTVGILALSSPLYLLLPIETNHEVTKFFLPFTAISTALLVEISADPSRPTLAALKTIYAGLAIAAAFALLFPFPVPHEMMPFFALPLAWLIIPLVSFVVEKVYTYIR